MRFLNSFIFIGIMFLYNIAIPQNARVEKPVSGLSILNKDINDNIINEYEAISQKIYYIFDRAKLNQKYVSQNQTPLECATPFILEYERNKEKLSLTKQNELTSYFEPNKTESITSQSYFSPSDLFELNYETTGADAVPLIDNDSNAIPDYVERIAEYCDHSWNLLVDSLGYRAPLTVNQRYQIGFQKMFASGYTIEEPFEKGYTKIILNNNFIEFAEKYGNAKDPMGIAKVTVAHEFKHAIQYMYTQWRDKSWFLELDAAWIEDIAYDDVNSYYDFLSTSQITNPASSFADGMGYGNCIWMHYLTQTFGLQINRDIWEIASARTCVSFSDSAHYNIFKEALSIHSSTIESAASEYFVWNYFTGANYNSQIRTYKDARFYPTPKLYTEVTEIPSSGFLLDRKMLSADFIKIQGNTIKNQIGINLKFDNSINAAALVVKHKTGSYELKYLEQIDKSIDYLYDSELKDAEEIIIIPVSISSSTGNYNYTFQINNVNSNIDVTKPVISVEAYESQLSANNFPYMIVADIRDDSGVDSAYIEYNFDDGVIKRSQLERTDKNTFNGCICLDSLKINSLRELNYRIVAIDSSVSGNVGVNPEEGFKNIKIEHGLNITSAEDNSGLMPDFELFQNYPNPFNPSTVISYQLPVAGHVALKVFDLLGKEVTTLINEQKAPGKYEVKFDGSELASGVYLYKIQTSSGFVSTKKLTLLK